MTRQLAELIAARSAATPTACYLLDARSDRKVSYADLAGHTAARAAELTGLGRVLLDVDDPLRFALGYLSLLAAGCGAVPVDPAAPDADVARTIRSTAPAAVLTDRPGRWAGAGLRVLDATAAPTPDEPAADRAERTGSVLMQTSGSTGEPKLIELAEHRLLHVAGAVAENLRLGPGERGYNPLPLFHINGQVVGLLATLVAGGSLVLDRRFRRTGFWPLIEQHQVSWINGVPAILTILSREPLPARPARLRLIRSASAPLPVAVRDLITGALGVPVVESYGMTEAASQITATDLAAPAPAGSVGRPVRAELQVRGEDGAPAPAGVTGAVWIRGAGIVTGYADGRAAERFDAGGWLDTGDLGTLDGGGNLFLAGRADDVINRGGELVYPREVEEILLADPRVSEAVVVGRPDDVLGQVPVAQLVVSAGLDRAGTERLLAELAERCRLQLSRFKCPVDFAVVESFPRASVGKIRRHLVRKAAAAPGTTAPPETPAAAVAQ
ncbi:MAG TPA: AMP-binding protein [Jatrophihabitans sp.]|nr:AMP-binding protein [Jatrophihabitans sp.]